MLRTNLLDVADLAIVFCHGTITDKEDIEALQQAVATKLTKTDVVLDFSEVETFGPETLMALVALWHAADRQAARLAIFNPSLVFYLELRRIRSLCRIAVLTDAELLRLLRQAEAVENQPAQRPARHCGLRFSRALRYASTTVALLGAATERVFGVLARH